jgi:hypothetical protein
MEKKICSPLSAVDLVRMLDSSSGSDVSRNMNIEQREFGMCMSTDSGVFISVMVQLNLAALDIAITNSRLCYRPGMINNWNPNRQPE